jgi:hypothetical protein
MSKTFEDRLRDAKTVLDKTHAAIGRNPGRISPEAEELFRKVIQFGGDVEHWIGMLHARATAAQLLGDLEKTADANDYVALGQTRARFQHVRLIGVQSYLTTTWALADRVTCMVGRVICPPNAGANPMSPAQLVSHFVTMDKQKVPAALVSKSVRHAFGWPIAISYAIRNHVVHDGAQFDGVEFFEGPTAGAAFRVSVDGWNRMVDKAESYGAVASYIRASGWPATPRDDLRAVLAACEREMDEALGVLLSSACGLLMGHVACMVGED